MTKQTPITQGLTVLSAEYQQVNTKNRFESFNDFKEFVETSFIEGSGIDPELFKQCIEFHEDLELHPGGDVETPIHSALNWVFTRFGRQSNEPFYAAF